jgi:hypothetical protein
MVNGEWLIDNCQPPGHRGEPNKANRQDIVEGDNAASAKTS